MLAVEKKIGNSHQAFNNCQYYALNFHEFHHLYKLDKQPTTLLPCI